MDKVDNIDLCCHLKRTSLSSQRESLASPERCVGDEGECGECGTEEDYGGVGLKTEGMVKYTQESVRNKGNVESACRRRG